MEVEREVVFPASPEEVWEALTEAERLEEWFANDVELDPREGGEGVFRWEDGEERHATVREADPPHRIVLDWDDDGTTAIELEEVEDGTRVHVVETAPGFATALELKAFALVGAAAGTVVPLAVCKPARPGVLGRARSSTTSAPCVLRPLGFRTAIEERARGHAHTWTLAA